MKIENLPTDYLMDDIASMLDAAGLAGFYVDFFLATCRDGSRNLGHVFVVFASLAVHGAAVRLLRSRELRRPTGLAFHVPPVWVRVEGVQAVVFCEGAAK